MNRVECDMSIKICLLLANCGLRTKGKKKKQNLKDSENRKPFLAQNKQEKVQSFFIGVYLLDNVVLISAVQQSESAAYIYPLPLGPPSNPLPTSPPLDHHRALS